MLYDLYFHDDFDGRAAGAVMLSFLRSRGDDIEHYVPVNYDILPQWSGEGFFKKNRLFRGKHNPAIVVDFLYHPKAAWWFDHHPTAFRNEAWRKRFKPSKFHHFGPEYKSACHLVEAALKADFGWKPPKHFKGLVAWLDIYDGANYRSPGQTFDLRQPGLAIAAFIDDKGRKEKYMTDAWLVGQIVRKPLSVIAKDRKVKSILKAIEKKTEAGLLFYRKNLKVSGDVAFINLGSQNIGQLRFVPFYFHPKLKYAVKLTRESDSHYHLVAGVSPWQRGESKIHIGEMLKKHFKGAGGHKTVGGAEFKTRKEALAAAEKVVAILSNKNIA
jgi:hypothetical protein